MRRRTLQRSLVSCASCLAGNKSSRYLQLTEHYELCDHFFYWLRTFVKNSLRSLSCQEPRILEFRGYKRTDAKTGQRVIRGLAIAPISSFLCLVASLGLRQSDNEFEM